MLWIAIRLPQLPHKLFAPVHSSIQPRPLGTNTLATNTLGTNTLVTNTLGTNTLGTDALGTNCGEPLYRHLNNGEPKEIQTSDPDRIVFSDHKYEFDKRLFALANIGYQFSPHLKVYFPKRDLPPKRQQEPGITFEVSGCLRHFQNLQALYKQLQSSVSQLEVNFKIAVGHSASAAWALTQSEYPINNQISQKELLTRLCSLPLSHMSEHQTVFQQLSQKGLLTLNDVHTLYKTHYNLLEKDYDQSFLCYLDSLFSIRNNTLTRYKEAKHFHLRYALREATASRQNLIPIMEGMIKQLDHWLKARQQYHTEIQWKFTSPFQQKKVICIHSQSIKQDWKSLLRKTQSHVKSQYLEFDVSTIELIVTRHHSSMIKTQYTHQKQCFQQSTTILNNTHLQQSQSSSEASIQQLKNRNQGIVVYKKRSLASRKSTPFKNWDFRHWIKKPYFFQVIFP
ncbi:hypothetical protein [Marinibactrum halimedae]|uniref:Uncharacterized protein n=1 Tax=Marinibactrum halimedae TaxID=1444977 RepID=A0AA37WJM9_9GAMM|nr:hypothetical protein [Marinibactrum halimedae]MCD9460304.1 hypothetical protein [Marinibactrum halimedae]GLS24393.1 hypothetical protein GCM10007877_01040 [Marinibactrum halimedae]